MEKTALLIGELQGRLRSASRLLPRSAGSKLAYEALGEGMDFLDVRGLRGVIEYEPEELTFSAYAGTPMAEIEAMLAENGQYLPFDPLFVESGATLGGTVAVNAAGPGRHRFGGVRDFLLGVRFLDGLGEVVRGGGKVVKNSAGFDLPKLMVGSFGALGVLLEVSFKVFPRPQAFATLEVTLPTLEETLEKIRNVIEARLDVEALDFAPQQGRYRLWARLGGLEVALAPRLKRLAERLPESVTWQGEDEADLWRQARELAWAPREWNIVRVALTPRRIPALEQALEGVTVVRRYSAGGQVAWLACAEPLETLEARLTALGLSGRLLRGRAGRTRFGIREVNPFYRRVKQALDPQGRFVEV